MADNSPIEWTDASWNPLAGCSLVSPGCTNCYAMKMAHRLEAMALANPAQDGQSTGPLAHYAGTTQKTKAGAVWTGKINIAPDHILTQPLRWKRPRKIFVNSMSDLFHPEVPDDVIDKVFAIMALCPQHTFQVLTKRADRMRAYMLERWQGTTAFELDGVHFPAGPETGRHYQVHMAAEELVDDLGLADTTKDELWDEEDSLKIMKWSWPLPNVWLGVSVEDQARADERIPDLLHTPAAIRFISAEPLLGPVDLGEIAIPRPDLKASYIWDVLRGWGGTPSKIDWVIAGGENGDRPGHPDWFRSLRDQCADAEVPFFFKQWGSWRQPAPGDEYDTSQGRAGKPPAYIVSRDGTVHCFQSPSIEAPAVMVKVGKKAAGNHLDGVQHLAWPQATPKAMPPAMPETLP